MPASNVFGTVEIPSEHIQGDVAARDRAGYSPRLNRQRLLDDSCVAPKFEPCASLKIHKNNGHLRILAEISEGDKLLVAVEIIEGDHRRRQHANEPAWAAAMLHVWPSLIARCGDESRINAPNEGNRPGCKHVVAGLFLLKLRTDFSGASSQLLGSHGGCECDFSECSRHGAYHFPSRSHIANAMSGPRFELHSQPAAFGSRC